jgi:hypothetical protein
MSSVGAEEFANPDWRHKDRSQGEEVSRRIEWREKRHSQPSIRHGIKHAMRSGAEKKIEKQPRHRYHWVSSMPQNHNART